MLTEVLNGLARLPAPAVLLVTGFLAFSETGIGFGFLIPGETGVLLMATTATTVPMFVAMSVVVWLSAAAGDSFGYAVGRRYGVHIRETRLMRRVGQDKWDRAGDLLHRYGVRTVVISRFLPAVRVLTPATAGAMRLPYPRFVAASLSGAFVWAIGHVALGAFAGASVRAIEHTLGAVSWIVLALLLLAASLAAVRRHRRAHGA